MSGCLGKRVSSKGCLYGMRAAIQMAGIGMGDHVRSRFWLGDCAKPAF
jgi:hypothetical protein